MTRKEIYNVLLNDNWRFGLLSLKLIFDLVACKDRMYFGIYLSAKITKFLASIHELELENDRGAVKTSFFLLFIARFYNKTI